MLEVRNLAFSYASRDVLKDVSFVVSPGETVSVVGANGAGKTTLLRLLATLAVPSGGQILNEGQNVLAHPLKFRRQLGYLPERVALYDDMTAREYLVYRAELKGEIGRRIRRRLSEAAEICRISESVLKRPLGTLSAGQKKRVALADAFLLRPRVLLLDDFLAGLDLEMRATAGEILSAAAAFSSVIVTGHELEDLARWTTRFLVLKDGVISAAVPTSGRAPAEVRACVAALVRGQEARP